jgi:hypothetical protein
MISLIEQNIAIGHPLHPGEPFQPRAPALGVVLETQ